MSNQCVHITEGIETALSIKQALKCPVYAALGASNLSNISVGDAPEVHFWIDKDRSETGQKEAMKAVQKLQSRGVL